MCFYCSWLYGVHQLVLLTVTCFVFLPAHAAGSVQYNKEAASMKIYRNLVRHVPLDNALEGGLTVDQNLALAAHLSLPPHFTPFRRASLVKEVLELLGVTPLQHCLVGSPGTAGLHPSQPSGHHCSILGSVVQVCECPKHRAAMLMHWLAQDAGLCLRSIMYQPDHICTMHV